MVNVKQNTHSADSTSIDMIIYLKTAARNTHAAKEESRKWWRVLLLFKIKVWILFGSTAQRHFRFWGCENTWDF